MPLFEKKTKWIPLATYNSVATDYIVFVRRGLKTGMLYFKTKRVTPLFVCSHNLVKNFFDVSLQFDKALTDNVDSNAS